MVEILKLLANIDFKRLNGQISGCVNNITHEHRSLGNGDCFICLKGKSRDGHRYIDYAISRGVAMIVTQENYVVPDDCKTLVILVANTRRAYAIMAGNFYNNPSKQLQLIGVVGTNGKTTTAHLIYEIFSHSGIKAGFIGTHCYKIGKNTVKTEMTTPDPMQLNAILSEMVAKKITLAVMEVSAHAIFLEKLFGLYFKIGVFTNFSQDHLDFFNTLDEYKRVKQSFFNSKNIMLAVINIDDECGREIAMTCDVPVLSYALDNNSFAKASDIVFNEKNTSFLCTIGDESVDIVSRLIGRYNVYNLLAGLSVARFYGISFKNLSKIIKEVSPPSGRFNLIEKFGRIVVIDYAHTPDGMEKLLLECRRSCRGKIITVFGCGGDRDITKRPIMGKIAGELSDTVIVTSDNPRGENPDKIIENILTGIDKFGVDVFSCVDREKAINKAFRNSAVGDWIVLLGKGDEDYIEIGTEKIMYSDYSVVNSVQGVECD